MLIIAHYGAHSFCMQFFINHEISLSFCWLWAPLLALGKSQALLPLILSDGSLPSLEWMNICENSPGRCLNISCGLSLCPSFLSSWIILSMLATLLSPNSQSIFLISRNLPGFAWDSLPTLLPRNSLETISWASHWPYLPLCFPCLKDHCHLLPDVQGL